MRFFDEFINTSMKINEITKTLTPQKLQVKSLADKAKQITQQKKQLVAQQALQNTQLKMRQANAVSNVK